MVCFIKSGKGTSLTMTSSVKGCELILFCEKEFSFHVFIQPEIRNNLFGTPKNSAKKIAK